MVIAAVKLINLTACLGSVRRCGLVGFLLLISLLKFSDLQAQDLIQWSFQARIPEYEDSTEVPPFLVAGQDMIVHAFNSQPLDLTQDDSPRAVFYRRWSLEQGWSDPIDIILNPNGNSLNLLDVFLDNQGVVHLLIQMNLTNLYYARANLAAAEQAPAWSVPILLDDQSVTTTFGVSDVGEISGDDSGRLVVLYSGHRDGNGIYTVESIDGGNTWSNSLPIYLTGDKEILPVSPTMSVGAANNIHAVWSTFYDDGSGGPGYYTQLDLSNGRWREPVELDVPGIRTPNVIEYEGDIIVTYYHNNENKNWWRKSSDGGLTWSTPVLISSLHKGTNGITSFAVDSDNNLHLFFAQRIDDNNHGLWHTLWNGNGWSTIEPVVRGPQIRDEIGGRGFDPHSAQAIIVNGNRLLVTWVTDGFAGLNGAWYATATLDSPELPILPQASLTPVHPQAGPVGDVEQRSGTPAPTQAPTMGSFNSPADENGASESPATLLFFGLIPTAVLIAGVVVVHQIYYRTK